MDNNTAFFINSIIYSIYNTEDFENLKIYVLESLKTLIQFECASFIMAEESGGLQHAGQSVTIPHRYAPVEDKFRMFEEYDYSKWHMQGVRSSLVRATDLMDEEQRVDTIVYKNCLKPFNLHYSLDLSIASNNKFLGFLILYRQKAQGDFTDNDLFLLQLLSDHLNIRFYREKYEAGSGFGSGSGSDIGHTARLIADYGLTSREAEITSLVLSGKSNTEICSSLNISINTLKKHLQNIYRKTGVSGRTQLMALQLI